MKDIQIYFSTGLVLFSFFLLASCQTIEGEFPSQPDMIPAERGTEMLSIFEEIDLIALSLVQQEVTNGRSIKSALEHYGDKVTISRSPGDNSVTVDFGAGSESDRGVKFRGIYKMYHPLNFWAKGSVTQIELDGFFVDGVQVSGVRTLSNVGFEVSNKTLTFEANMEKGTVTWPGEESIEVNYHHRRNLEVASVSAKLRFHLTGKTELKDKYGRRLIAEVVKPMVFQETCMVYGKPDPSSGSLLISRGDSEKIVKDFYRDCK
ncbi:MAG: hypothetical protein JJU34_09005 [Lunatimonas sp.]|uniref:hypothetical protein n=1 Tax=Lunatimonas sp. TaxID=2060141 RepID=UPI00263B267C|nr:hypothetical protein [Lunatimonas sp.]MCC5937407.1 hypothetical protein [Lunatimonas sp.]